MSSDGSLDMQTHRKTILLYDNCYQLGFLWKLNANLPNNYKTAIAQYHRIKIQLNKKSEKLVLYQDTIDKDVSSHFIGKLRQDTITSIKWILPEHWVIKPNTKASPLFQCQIQNQRNILKWHAFSLTWLILQPNYRVTRFRKRKHPITTDIEGICRFQLTPKTKKFFVTSEELKNPTFFRVRLFRLWSLMLSYLCNLRIRKLHIR